MRTFDCDRTPVRLKSTPKASCFALTLTATIAAIIPSPRATGQCVDGQVFPSGVVSASRFGTSIGLDGTTLVVGADKGNGSAIGTGSAYIYTEGPGGWLEEAKIFPNVGVSNDFFGQAVDVCGDTVAVGAFGVNGPTGNNNGAAYIFERTGTAWSQTQILLSDNPVTNAYFGFSIALDGDTCIVGANRDSGGGTQRGAAYVFVQNAGVWSLQAKLLASDGMDADRFATSVAIAGDWALVGAPLHDSPLSQAGAVYAYSRSGGVWTEQAILTPTDTAINDLFGESVDLSGNGAVIGTSEKDSKRGAAYVFRRAGSTWSEEAKLLGWDTLADDLYGASVAIDGDRIIVGSTENSTLSASAGAIYVYDKVGNEWRDTMRGLAPDGASGDDFGASVAISGSRVAGASLWKDIPGIMNVGSAYVLDPASYGESYGLGCQGTGGFVPVLRVDGCPDQPVLDLFLQNALGGSFGLILIGGDESMIPVGGGCNLLVSPLLSNTVPFPLPGSGAGAGNFSFSPTIPATSVAGSFTIQAVVFDPFSAVGYTMSNGVAVTIP